MTLPDGVQSDALTDPSSRGSHSGTTLDVPFSDRLLARMFATRYDHQVEDGVRVEAGTPLAAHYTRLASYRERDEMAQALTVIMRDAGLNSDLGGTAARLPVRADAVQESADVFERVLAQLMGLAPVRARGMARLRILLSDGRGPLYCKGQGSLSAALRGVLAAF